MPYKLILEVTRDGWTNGLQINIAQLGEDDKGWGYRLAGPKFNGSSTTLLKTELDQRDADEIRKYLDDVFPTDATAEIESLRKERDDFRDQRNSVFETNKELLARVDHWQGQRDNYAAENRKLIRQRDDLEKKMQAATEETSP